MYDRLSTVNNKLPEDLKDLMDKMSQLSWRLMETVPPLVSETIHDISFCKDWHAKEGNPEWNKDLAEYRLVYYRPILFFSYEGKVSKKGWVGNEKSGSAQCAVSSCNVLDMDARATLDKVEVKSMPISYKKPCLKIQGATSFPSREQSLCAKPGTSTDFVIIPKKQTATTPHYHGSPSKETSDDSSGYVFGLRKYN